MGMLDAAGGGTRRFGGLGVALSRPAAIVEASSSDEASTASATAAMTCGRTRIAASARTRVGAT